MALIKNITSSVIFKLTLIVQLPFLVSILLELMTICDVIFQQRKKKCWKLMRNSWKIEGTIRKWGKQWGSTDELFSQSDKFIYKLYGNKEKDVNNVWWLKLRGKYTKKVIEMSALPSCKETLKRHSARENYVPKM